MEVRRAPLVSLAILVFAFAFHMSRAAATEPTFTNDVQGQWHVLLGLPAPIRFTWCCVGRPCRHDRHTTRPPIPSEFSAIGSPSPIMMKPSSKIRV